MMAHSAFGQYSMQGYLLSAFIHRMSHREAWERGQLLQGEG
jgi:hypothetical protein